LRETPTRLFGSFGDFGRIGGTVFGKDMRQDGLPNAIVVDVISIGEILTKKRGDKVLNY
jgi:hypothetical protein